MRVHLASAENPEWSGLLHDLKYPFRLASYYYVAKDESARLPYMMECAADGSEWILDSGLYTLMFGADKGKLKTFDQYRDYALRYREDVERWGWKHPIVECDVQRVLGMEECQRIRDEVFEDYIGEVIYVWHTPEGIEGLRKLAREKSYIAISVPELRVIYKTPSAGGPRVKRAITELLAIIREEGNPKVHLLGCTESDLLRLPAYSADSTSWYSSGRFGTAYILERGSLKSVSAYSPKYNAWREFIVKHPRWRDGFAAIRSRQEANRTAAAVEYFEGMGVGAATFNILMDIVNE
jgi:hypothetical protein